MLCVSPLCEHLETLVGDYSLIFLFVGEFEGDSRYTAMYMARLQREDEQVGGGGGGGGGGIVLYALCVIARVYNNIRGIHGVRWCIR